MQIKTVIVYPDDAESVDNFSTLEDARDFVITTVNNAYENENDPAWEQAYTEIDEDLSDLGTSDEDYRDLPIFLEYGQVHIEIS